MYTNGKQHKERLLNMILGRHQSHDEIRICGQQDGQNVKKVGTTSIGEGAQV